MRTPRESFNELAKRHDYHHVGEGQGVPLTAVGHGLGPAPDADGGDVSFHVGKPYKYGKPGAFRWLSPNDEEILSIDKEGMFRVRGEVVAEDRLAYEGFRLWLSTAIAGVDLGNRSELERMRERVKVLEAERKRLLKDSHHSVQHRADMAKEIANLRCGAAGGPPVHLQASDGYSFCGGRQSDEESVQPVVSNTTCRDCLVARAKDAETYERRERKPKKVLRRMSMKDRRRMRRLEEAVVWMSAAPAFGKGGEARQGFVRLIRPVLMEISEAGGGEDEPEMLSAARQEEAESFLADGQRIRRKLRRR
jgi:hypothetical protein